MITPIFHGTVEKGILKADLAYYKWLNSLEGCRVHVKVEKEKKQRSLNQNSYYWGIIVQMLADFTGYSPDEMHEALKEKFLGCGRDQYGLAKIKSTTALTTDEFEEYMTNCRRLGDELGFFIPLPNECEY